jgi:D-beta-D-heptose 7-phosphate kinase/D-beta-D-heptose 1-phosphate adenosyltransferase
MNDRRLIESFANHRILVIGDVMLDEYLSGECSRISPEAPVPILAVAASRVVLGGAANTAHNIVALGGQCVLVGAIGDDDTGRALGNLARSAGIDFAPVQHGRPTVRKVRVVGQQQQLLRLDYESAVPSPAAEAAQPIPLMEVITSHLPGCSMVVMSDYAKGLLTETVSQQLIAAAHEAGVRVVIDPRPQHASFYTGCDYITPNWKEALGLTGRPEQAATASMVMEVGRELARRFDSNILLTLGAKGITFFDRDGEEKFSEPAMAREVFDVSGAGDTVVAAFSLALAAGATERDAIALANRAAGISVGKLGTATVSPAELLNEGSALQRLVDRTQLGELAAWLRAQGKRIVTINGSFDLLHAGHVHILREARRQGDVLIVGLNSDQSVRRYKGDGRPFVAEADRAELLLGLRDVDYVHVFDEDVPMPFIEQVKPHVHVNGAEYGEDCIEAPLVRSLGARLHLIDRLPGLSTSDLAARIAGKTIAGK